MDYSLKSVDDLFTGSQLRYYNNVGGLKHEYEQLEAEIARVLPAVSGSEHVAATANAEFHGVQKYMAVLAAVYFDRQGDDNNKKAYLDIARQFAQNEAAYQKKSQVGST